MPNLEWSTELVLDLPAMDNTHREFVDLLAVVEAAEDDVLLARWAELIDHTDDHFGREDEWMQATNFARSNCHSMQHGMVLQVMRAGLKHGQEGHLALVRQMARELAVWFPQHASAMDAALAKHLGSVGFDPATGQLSKPEALPQEEIHGCGGSTCSDNPAPPDQALAEAEAAVH